MLEFAQDYNPWIPILGIAAAGLIAIVLIKYLEGLGQQSSPTPHPYEALDICYGRKGTETIPLRPEDQKIYGIDSQQFAMAHEISELALHEAAHVAAFVKIGAQVARSWIRDPKGLPPQTRCTAPVNDPFLMAVAHAAGGAIGAIFNLNMRESGEDQRLVEESCAKARRKPDDARKEAVRLLNDPYSVAAVQGIATQLDRDGQIFHEDIMTHARDAGIA